MHLRMDTLRHMRDLGLLWRAEGKNTKAEQLTIKVLDIRRRVVAPGLQTRYAA